MICGVRDALVLLHGFTQTRQSWRRVTNALGAGRYRALAPDLPGHGLAEQRRPVSFAACAAYVRALAPERFALCGYSMGGRIALHAALELGERVQRLVLVGASPGLADPAERERRRAADEALADRIEAIGVEAFAREWGALPLFAGQPERVAAAAHADRLRNTAPGLAAALRGLGTGAMEPLWDRLGELAMPVTLVVGERDEKFRAIAERMRDAIPDARVVVVPGAGHAAHLERPDAIGAVLRT
jgi:2-succinyl-6-hydroxy-2,4-cyclohexadiene-1-carboxylate synthase